jgi:hypothetical protein
VLAFFFSFTPNTLFFFFSKNFGINPGQPAGKGWKKKKKKTNQRCFCHRKSLWPVTPQKTLPELSRHGQTDRQTNAINSIDFVNALVFSKWGLVGK